jgi:excisionase family DNA binding protein
MARTNDTSGEGHPLSDGRRKYFAVAEVAGYLGLGRRTAYELCYRGDLRAHKFGGCIRVSREEILRFEREGANMGRGEGS